VVRGVILLWAAVWLALPGLARAAEAELEVVVGQLQVGQVGLVRVTVRGDRPTAPPRIPVRPDTGLELRFRRQSQQVEIVNSRVSRQYEFVYSAEALEDGTYTIGPAEVEIGTRRTRTGSATLKVVPRREGPADELEVFAGFDVEQAWVGQVVVYKRGVRSRVRVLRDSWTDPPLDGLLPPRDGTPAYAEYVIQDPAGDTFVKEEMHPKVVVSPGTREVPRAVARLQIPRDGGGPMGFTRSQTRVLPTEPSTLEVRARPAEPPGFSGLVGDFTFESEVDRTRAAVGESVNWSVRVRGDGALEGFSLPRIQSDQARVYPGSPATSARVDADGYRAEGRFDQVIVPTEPGRLVLGPVRVVTFSPSRGEYVTHDIDLPPLTVTRGKGAGGGDVESFLDTDALDTDLQLIEEPYEGVRPVRTAGRAHAAWLGGLVPWTLGLAGLPLVVLGALEGGRVARRGLRSLATRRARRAPRPLTPTERLRALPEDPDDRLAELDAALRQAVARALDLDVATLDRARDLERLPDALADEVRRLTRRLDRARFGGGDRTDLVQPVRDAVVALERFRGGQP
jgi:hypothetical protein